jgi:hypothetical protein
MGRPPYTVVYRPKPHHKFLQEQMINKSNYTISQANKSSLYYLICYILSSNKKHILAKFLKNLELTISFLLKPCSRVFLYIFYRFLSLKMISSIVGLTVLVFLFIIKQPFQKTRYLFHIVSNCIDRTAY